MSWPVCAFFEVMFSQQAIVYCLSLYFSYYHCLEAMAHYVKKNLSSELFSEEKFQRHQERYFHTILNILREI